MTDLSLTRLIQQLEREVQHLHRRVDLLELQVNNIADVSVAGCVASIENKKRSSQKEIPEARLTLFDRLKEWRLEIARKAEAPAFTVLTNNTLAEIAIQTPSTAIELDSIPGMGEQRMELYAEDILRIVEDFLKST